MRVAVFSSKPYDEQFLAPAAAAAGADVELHFLEARLDPVTAALAEGYDAVCAFVNDDLGAATLRALADRGVQVIALRSAGYNHVDRATAAELGLVVSHVPAYSPYAVAEHAAGLILALNRHLPRAYARVRDHNFSIAGLLGFDLHGRTVGVVGTGLIGGVFARIMLGFGCRVLAYDVRQDPDLTAGGVAYVELDELFAAADIISLHCPLNPATFHLVDERRLGLMRRGAMLINTSRGALVDTKATIEALKTGHLGHLGLDVYEEEGPLFFEDLSEVTVGDDVFARLLTFPNVIVTGHQAFFTAEALARISEVTVANLTASARGQVVPHLVPAP